MPGPVQGTAALLFFLPGGFFSSFYLFVFLHV